MSCPQLAPAAAHCTDDHGDRKLPAEHITKFGRLVDNVIHRREGEVNGHQLCNRTLPHHRRADRPADDGILRDGRILDPLGTVFVVKPFCDCIGTAPHTDFLAHDKDGGVTVHFFHQCLRDRLAHCYFSHNSTPVIGIQIYKVMSNQND